MSKAILTAAILAGAGAYMAVNSPANALQVTGSILNPGAILTSNGNPGTQTLNFPTFTSANFPAAFAGLLPNQTLRLNNIQLTILGSPSGSFSVQNADTVNTVAVANNVYNMNIVANGATSTSSALLSNATTPNTPVATASTVPSTIQPTCTPPQVLVTQIFVGTPFYWCQAPGVQSYSLTSAPITPLSWFIAPTAGNINSISSSFWTSGAQASLPATITFTSDITKLSGGTPTLVNPNPLTFTVSATAASTFITYDYNILTSAGVPAPLPLLGAGMSFSFTRRLRRRIRQVA